MGKKKKATPITPAPIAPTAPAFSASGVYMDGIQRAKTYKDPVTGELRTEYISDPNELAQKKAREAQIAAYEGQINTFDPSLTSQWDKIRNDYINRNSKEFDQQWDKSSRNTLNDIVSRFGNTDTSIYRDSMKDLDRIKADAYTKIAQDASVTGEQLKQQELQNRYNYLNQLRQGIQDYNTERNTLFDQANNGSSLINNYNNQQFGTNAGIYSAQLNSYNQALDRAAQQKASKKSALGRSISGFAKL